MAAERERLRSSAAARHRLARRGPIMLLLARVLRSAPLRRSRRLLAAVARLGPVRSGLPLPPDLLGSELERLAPGVPGAGRCLVRALAAEALLRACGSGGCLRIGVRRTGEGLAAHAWVECDGRVCVGAGERRGFTSLRRPGPSR